MSKEIKTRNQFLLTLGVHGGLVVSVLDCQSKGSGVQIPASTEIWIEISASLAPLSQLSYDEYTKGTLSVSR